MKKRMYSAFLVMLAMLCSQQVLAGSFSSTYSNIADDRMAGQEPTIVLQEMFDKGKGDFYVEGERGYSDDIWMSRNDHIEGTSYFKYSGGDMESYFVSKEFSLGLSDNYASFDHAGLYFYNDFEKRCSMVARIVGENEWYPLEGMVYPTDMSSGIFENTGDMVIPERFNGKRVQIAFRLTASSSYSDGIWMFKNLIVKTYGEMPEIKNEAGLSFAPSELTFTLGSGDFEEPVLLNPNLLSVTYSSDNENVATVDAATGEVNILGAGIVNISAVSQETADCYAGSAKYSITVTKPNSGISFDTTEVSYEIGSGEIFKAPVLNNPNNVAVNYASSNLNVAYVDYSTGKIEIKGMGTAEIKATSYETEQYAYSEAAYTITVTDPSVVFSALFADGFDGFTEEGSHKDIGIWTWKYGWVVASGSYLVYELTDTYLISQEFALPNDPCKVSFNMQGYNFNNWQDEAQLLAREVGGEWINIPIKTYPDNGNYNTYNSGDLEIPAELGGKNIQLAFKYVTDGNKIAGYWYINHLLVKKVIKKEEPGISFDVTEVNAEVGKEFKAPVLNNPNKLNIVYESNNPLVASVDEATGEVKINGIGIAKITARSLENKEFYEGTAEYTIHATDPSIVFFEDFSANKGSFTEEGTEGIWEWSWGGYMKADGFYKVTELSESYLVSPEITLDAKGNLVSFVEMASVFNGKIEEYAQLMIREAGSTTWETIEGLNRPMNDTYEPSYTGEAAIPEKYNGKNVQLAFKYMTDGYAISGMWYVTKLMVKRAVVEKADPEIAFDQASVEYTMGSELPFAAPVLANPNNVPVKYSSSDAGIAVADELTGEITFIGAGEVTITATSEETDEFKSGSASYVIIVKEVPTGIEGISADELAKAEIYDLQGRRVHKPGKGVYIVNGRKVVIK